MEPAHQVAAPTAAPVARTTRASTLPIHRPHVGILPFRVSISISSTHMWVGGLMLLGLALRLAWVLYLDTIPLGGDPSWYFSVARNLFEGKGFAADHLLYTDTPVHDEPTAFWPPAYPAVLAGVWKVFGFGVTQGKVLNAVLSAATIPFVYGLAAAIFNRRAGLLAAGVFAVFPNGIAWLPLLFPEAMFILQLVASLWLLVTFGPVRGRSMLVVAAAFGALAAFAALTRGQGLVLPPIALLFWLTRDGWRAAGRQGAVMLVVMAALIAPWTIRNIVVLDSPVLISTNAGVSLRTGHAPDSTGTSMWTGDPVLIDGKWVTAEQSPYRTEWEVQGYNEWTRRAIVYAFTHPQREWDLTRYKVYHLYRSDSGVIPWLTTMGVTPIEPGWLENNLWRVFDVSYYALLFAALLPVPFYLRRRDAGRLLLVYVVGVWTLFHIVFNGEPRYHVPLFPVLAVSAAGGVSMLAGTWRRTREHGAHARHHGYIGEVAKPDIAFLLRNKKFYLEEEDYDLVEVTDSMRLESLFHRGRSRLVRRLLARHGRAPYVDAGCGTGLMLRHLPAGAIGVDINPRLLPRARRNAPQAAIVHGDLEQLPLRPGSVNTIVMTEVLEHFPNPDDVLRHMTALLAPGGKLIGSVPSQSPIWNLRFLSGSPAGEPFHKNYSRDGLRELLSSHFTDVEIGAGNTSMSLYFVATKEVVPIPTDAQRVGVTATT
jgi:SAM-dependent methyltransferase/4-amino-4-deoxy-L-arabinose transferase-like glycosyltransferase